MSIRPPFPLLAFPLLALAVGATVAAQESRPSRSAKAFRLDSLAPAPEPSATPAPSPTPSPAPAATADPAPMLPAPGIPASAAVTAPPGPAATAPAVPPSAPGALRATFTLDTPIADLIADPAARAVLDKDLPGLSTDDNLDKFARLGLRQFQPLTGGQLSEAMLGQVARDLAGLGDPLRVPVAPTTTVPSKRNRDVSR